MKTGIFGGSFDPPHNGHIAAAEAALTEAGLDKIVFVPARVSPLKIGQMRAPDHARLAMLRLALADKPRFSISDYELGKPDVSFTIDTVRHFRETNPDDELHLVIGADSLATLPRWKDADELMRLCKFVVLARPGFRISGDDENHSSLPTDKFTFVNDFSHPASSTEIRRRIAAGESAAPAPVSTLAPALVPTLLPTPVAEYILCHGLYGVCK